MAFYACDWVIEEYFSYSDFDKLLMLARQLDCDLWLEYSTLHKTENGFQTFRWQISTANEETLMQLEQYFAKFGNQIHCEPVSTINAQFPSLTTLVDLKISDMVLMINETVEYNRSIINKTPMWAFAVWFVSSLSADDLTDILEILRINDCHLYYLWEESESQHKFRYKSEHVQLLLQLNDVRTLDTVAHGLRRVIAVEHWSLRFRHFHKISSENFIELSQETKTDFRTLIDVLSKCHNS